MFLFEENFSRDELCETINVLRLECDTLIPFYPWRTQDQDKATMVFMLEGTVVHAEIHRQYNAQFKDGFFTPLRYETSSLNVSSGIELARGGRTWLWYFLSLKN